MSLTKNPMSTQDAKVRAGNFHKVATGYTEDIAIDDAMRLLNCKTMPCVFGCPVNIHIPDFIGKIKEGDFEGAYEIIAQAFLRYADEYAHRKLSASANAKEVLRVNRSELAD